MALAAQGTDPLRREQAMGLLPGGRERTPGSDHGAPTVGMHPMPAGRFSTNGLAMGLPLEHAALPTAAMAGGELPRGHAGTAADRLPPGHPTGVGYLVGLDEHSNSAAGGTHRPETNPGGAPAVNPSTPGTHPAAGPAVLPSTLLLATGVFKLLLQYVQMLSSMQSIALDVPLAMSSTWRILDVTSLLTSLQPLQCMVAGSNTARITASMVVGILLPVIFVAVACGLCALLYQGGPCHPSLARVQRPQRAMVVSAVMTGLFFYPAVSKQLLQIFSYLRLDRPENEAGAVAGAVGWYWRQSPGVQYGHGAHRALLLAVGVPGLLVFALGFPAALFLELYPHRLQLRDLQIRACYGMLFEDYTASAYYWQSVVLLLQLLLIVCGVLLTPLGPNVQLLSALLVVVCYSYVHEHVRPFASPRLQHLSQLTSLALMVSMVLLMYMANAAGNPGAVRAIVALFIIGNVLLVLHLIRIALLDITGRHSPLWNSMVGRRMAHTVQSITATAMARQRAPPQAMGGLSPAASGDVGYTAPAGGVQHTQPDQPRNLAAHGARGVGAGAGGDAPAAGTTALAPWYRRLHESLTTGGRQAPGGSEQAGSAPSTAGWVGNLPTRPHAGRGSGGGGSNLAFDNLDTLAVRQSSLRSWSLSHRSSQGHSGGGGEDMDMEGHGHSGTGRPALRHMGQMQRQELAALKYHDGNSSGSRPGDDA